LNESLNSAREPQQLVDLFFATKTDALCLKLKSKKPITAPCVRVLKRADLEFQVTILTVAGVIKTVLFVALVIAFI